MTDIPKWGKILCVLAIMVFIVACAAVTQQNVKLRRKGDVSTRKLAEIITAATLSGFGLIILVYSLWEFI